MRLSVRAKLILLGALPVFFYCLSNLYMIGEQRKTFDQMNTEFVEVANRVDTLVLNADRDMYQAYAAFLKLGSGPDKAEADLLLQEMAENKEQALERAAEARDILERHGLLQLAGGASGQSIQQIMDDFQAHFTQWYEAAEKAASSGGANALDPELDRQFHSGRAGIDEVGESLDAHNETRVVEIKSELDSLQLTTFIAVLVITVVMAVMIALTIRRFMSVIRKVVAKTQRVSEGDLTPAKEAKYGKDELGLISRSVDHMIEAMQGLISGIAANAAKVGQSSDLLAGSAKESAEATEHIARNIQEVAGSSEAQARGAEETSRAVEEMASGIGKIAENTSAMAIHSSETAVEASQGQAALNDLVNQMSAIQSAFDKLAGLIASLETRSQQIGAIADNITSFSNQTNILSLNASIEAARAGEQGKGFAVVAGEIRKLAASSLESADVIHELISSTRTDIADASSSMGQTLNEFESGRDKVAGLKRSFEAIMTSISDMAGQLHENSAITEQMSAGSEEVSASMQQTASSAALNMDKAENVAAAAEEQLALMQNISEAAEQLNGIVAELNREVSRFKL